MGRGIHGVGNDKDEKNFRVQPQDAHRAAVAHELGRLPPIKKIGTLGKIVGEMGAVGKAVAEDTSGRVQGPPASEAARLRGFSVYRHSFYGIYSTIVLPELALIAHHGAYPTVAIPDGKGGREAATGVAKDGLCTTQNTSML